MLYRCRACKHECDRRWLPSATCGLYLIFLLWLTATVMLAAAWAVKRLATALAQTPVEPPDAPP